MSKLILEPIVISNKVYDVTIKSAKVDSVSRILKLNVDMTDVDTDVTINTNYVFNTTGRGRRYLSEFVCTIFGESVNEIDTEDFVGVSFQGEQITYKKCSDIDGVEREYKNLVALSMGWCDEEDDDE